MAAADRGSKQEEFNEAVLGRVRGLESAVSDIQSSIAFLVEHAKSGAAGSKSGAVSESKSGADAKSGQSPLTAQQQQRLAQLEAATLASNSKLLGATEDQQKTLAEALKVSASALSNEAGAAAAFASFVETIQKGATTAKAKLADLAHAKNFEELNSRLVDMIAEGSSNKVFMLFIKQHLKIIIRLNEHKGWPAVKLYHYGVFDERDKQEKVGQDELNAFYMTCATGHTNLLSQADKYQDKGTRGGKGNRSGNRGPFQGGAGCGAGDKRGGRGGFRGGRGNSSPPAEPDLR